MTNKPQFVGERVRLGKLLLDTFSGEWGTEEGESLTPVLRTSNFNEDGSLDYSTPAMRCIPERKVAKKRMVRGDIILEKSGGTPKRPVGIMAFYDSDELALCSNFNQVLRFNEDRILTRFAFHQLRWLKDRNAFDRFTRKTTGLQNLQMKKLIELKLHVPQIEAQTMIADTLDKIVENQRTLQREVIDLDPLVKSRFVEMFGDPALSRDRWPIARVDAFASVITGNTPSRKHPEYYGEGTEWVKTDNIANSIVEVAAEQLTKDGRAKARVAPAGSILMACIAGSIKSIGKVGLLDREVAFNQQINAIVPSNKVNPRFLLTMLSLSKNYLCSDVNQQLKGILNKSALSAKQFPLPPLSLQQEFANFAAQVDKSRVVAQQQIEKLQMLYDSLAQEYFGD